MYVYIYIGHRSNKLREKDLDFLRSDLCVTPGHLGNIFQRLPLAFDVLTGNGGRDAVRDG